MNAPEYLEELDGSVLRLRGELHVAEWQQFTDEERAQFVFLEPDLAVYRLQPEGGRQWIGFLDEEGIYQCHLRKRRIVILQIAKWAEIERVTEYEEPSL
jgi:hypothetical protein